ncbi:putative U-box domain-containing protein 50 [Vicia villosa]|uniref:putative U-box domain-containing protein 50 n=1 Tax=Vicia villosa TaxID=3911 RepID=UPI00273C5251|nr:putative U-box domain-containing protein 50 [Vicia villosa]
MDSTQTEKIYVAVGYDVLDGFQTLDWALKKWNSHPNISIIILHVKYNPSNDHVYTLLGKLPAKGACEEKLERIRNYEQNIINNLLSKYIAICDKVPAETFEVEKFDKPMQNLTIDLILGLGITKLVIGFSFMRPSMKSKDAMNGLFYVHQHKPDFCELFIICGGKQVSPRVKNDEITMEDDSGDKVAKMRDYKTNIKDCIARIFCDKTIDSNQGCSSSSRSSTSSESQIDQNEWEFYIREIDNYFQELLSLNTDEGVCGQYNDDDSYFSPIEPFVQQLKNSDNKSGAEKFKILTDKLNEAYNTIQMKRKEEKENLERHAKAEWAIYISNLREEELEYLISEEMARKEELKKELNTEKEQIQKIRTNIEHNDQSLSSMEELQLELQSKLHDSALEISECETEFENVMAERTKMLMEIEELSRQRDVLNKRIMFFKENDGKKICNKLKDKSCCLEEYTEEEIIIATNNFSEYLRLKSGRDWSNVYRGNINNSNVAIKMIDSTLALSQQDFQTKLVSLGDIRHPHLVAVLGFCSDPKCLVFEYMDNGALEEALLCKTRRAISYQDCIRIAIEVCSGIGFLNTYQPRSIIHCHISASNILLDKNLVAKVAGFEFHGCNDECNVESDMKAIGALLLHLLTGRGNWVTIDTEAFFDEIGDEWPFDVAREVLDLAIRLISNEEISITRVMKELDTIKGKGCDSIKVPNIFLCPILQKTMRNPHIAADGYSYELEAIEEWLDSGNEISPKSLRLDNTLLFPNHNLRSLIQYWHSNRSATKKRIIY